MTALDQIEQANAIRRALGLPDEAEVTWSEPLGWQVRLPEHTAETAIRVGSSPLATQSATADTFVAKGAPTLIRSEAEFRERFGDGPTEMLLDAIPSLRTGSAADRERYVTMRAERLARAFAGAISTSGGSVAAAIDDYEQLNIVLAFRDLIDKGVLK